MADAQRVIELLFKGVDQTSAATQTAIANAKSVSQSVSDITGPIADFTVGALKFEAGLIAAGIAVTAFATKTAGDFDAAFREIATLIKKPVDDLEGFKTAIQQYAAGSTAPLEQVTTAVYNAISAGVEYGDAIKVVATAEQLSVAGKAELNDTLRVLVSSLNAYGLSMDYAGKFSDILFTTVKQGQTTLPELAQYFSQVTGGAVALKVPFEVLNAAIATLTAQGTPTAQAMTGINAAFTSILKPSQEAAGLARELGLNLSASAVQAKGFDVVIQEMQVATKGNAEQLQILVGSSEAFKAIAPLAGASASAFAKNIEEMRNSAGNTAEAFEKMKNNIELTTQKVANAFTSLMIDVGTPFLDEFGSIAGSIAAIFLSIGAEVKKGGLGGLVEYVEGLLGDLSATMATVAKNLPAALAQADFTDFKTGIDVVVQAVKNLFGNIDLTSVEGITRAIEIAGAAFLGFQTYIKGVIDAFKPLFDKLVEVGSGIGEVDTKFFEVAGNIGGAAIQVRALADGIGGAIPFLETLFSLLALKNGIGIVGSLASMATSGVGAAAAIGTGGLALAAAAAAYKIAELAKALYDWKTAQDQVDESSGRLKNTTAALDKGLQDLATALGIPIANYEEFDRLVKEGVIVADEASASWVLAGDSAKKLGEDVGKSWTEIDKNNEAMLRASQAAEDAATKQAFYNTEQKKIVPIIDEATGKIIGYEQNMALAATATGKLTAEGIAVSGSAKEVAKQVEKAAEAQMKWNLAIAELKSKEFIATIEAGTAIATARIEADAQTIQAAFESIGTTVQSTGDVIASLGGTLKDLMPNTDAFDLVQKTIEDESRRRDEALAVQNKLIEEQITNLRARTDALNRGEAMIKIDGAGLQPHLEAFMWEILRTLQVRVNQDGLEMLVGGF